MNWRLAWLDDLAARHVSLRPQPKGCPGATTCSRIAHILSAMIHTVLLFVGFVYFAAVFGQILGCAFRSSEPERDQEVLDACMFKPPVWRRR